MNPESFLTLNTFLDDFITRVYYRSSSVVLHLDRNCLKTCPGHVTLEVLFLLRKDYCPIPSIFETIVLSKSKLVKFSLIESVICIFTDSPVKRIFSTVKSVNFH